MVPLVLSHTDNLAPQLDDQDGSLYAVLKWALPQLGWTIAHDDPANFRLAARNHPGNGTGYFLRLLDQAADHNLGAEYARVEGYSSMSDVDTGTDQWPAFPLYWCKHGVLEDPVGPPHWRIIGTDTFFWLLINPHGDMEPNGPAGYLVFGAGDIISYKPADATHFVILANEIEIEGTNTAKSGICAINYAERVTNFSVRTVIPGALARSYDGAATGVMIEPRCSSPNVATTTNEPGSSGTYPDPISGGLVTSRLEVLEGSARRGLFPGILNPLVNIRRSLGHFSDGEMVSGGSNGRDIVDMMFVPVTTENGGLGGPSPNREGAFLFDVLTDWTDW